MCFPSYNRRSNHMEMAMINNPSRNVRIWFRKADLPQSVSTFALSTQFNTTHIFCFRLTNKWSCQRWSFNPTIVFEGKTSSFTWFPTVFSWDIRWNAHIVVRDCSCEIEIALVSMYIKKSGLQLRTFVSFHTHEQTQVVRSISMVGPYFSSWNLTISTSE